jgi:hypothetical protein
VQIVADLQAGKAGAVGIAAARHVRAAELGSELVTDRVIHDFVDRFAAGERKNCAGRHEAAFSNHDVSPG